MALRWPVYFPFFFSTLPGEPVREPISEREYDLLETARSFPRRALEAPGRRKGGGGSRRQKGSRRRRAKRNGGWRQAFPFACRVDGSQGPKERRSVLLESGARFEKYANCRAPREARVRDVRSTRALVACRQAGEVWRRWFSRRLYMLVMKGYECDALTGWGYIPKESCCRNVKTVTSHVSRAPLAAYKVLGGVTIPAVNSGITNRCRNVHAQFCFAWYGRLR